MKFNAQTIKHILQKTGATINEHSPAILVGCTVAGVVATAVLTSRATIKARKRYEQEVLARVEDGTDEPVPVVKDVIAMSWRYFVPPVIVGGTTIAACILGYRIQTKRTAAFAALYSGSLAMLDEYKKASEETVGPKQTAKIEDKVVENRLAAHTPGSTIIEETGHGHTLCYDMYSGRYFWSEMQFIGQSANEFLWRLINENALSFNDWYYELGLSGSKNGDEVGWSVDRVKDLKNFLSFTSKLASDGTPCLVLDYTVEPNGNYRDCW